MFRKKDSNREPLGIKRILASILIAMLGILVLCPLGYIVNEQYKSEILQQELVRYRLQYDVNTEYYRVGELGVLELYTPNLDPGSRSLVEDWIIEPFTRITLRYGNPMSLNVYTEWSGDNSSIVKDCNVWIDLNTETGLVQVYSTNKNMYAALLCTKQIHETGLPDK